MKLSYLIESLKAHFEEEGDLDIVISISEVKEYLEKYPDSNYITCQPQHIIAEKYGNDEKSTEIRISNWSY